MESPRLDNYPRLTLPIAELKPAYDVVVVGSGYGAGVAASRMARAGKSVAVLELGAEWRGSFPHTLPQCLRQLSISGSRRSCRLSRMEDKTRLFQLKLGEGQHAFCAHGLGGGSLINAGVFLKATPEVMRMGAWPEELREDSSLDEYYTRASSMLQPCTYPEPHPRLTKMQHLEECAQFLSQDYSDYSNSRGKGMKSNNFTFARTPLTTTFQAGRNSTGVAMHANQGSGHESTGLNDGSKNSVPVTYLADAWNWGAEIFCGCEVRYVEVERGVGGGQGNTYTVYFSWRGTGRDCFRDDIESQLLWVTAKEFCFLGAGALGTTEILLRSKEHGLGLSPMLGRNMSGNGDLLVFGYNGRKDINGIAGASTGPTITSMIDNRQTKRSGSPLEGYIIEDGCIPEPFAPVIQALLIAQTFRQEIFAVFHSPWTQFCKTIAAFKSLLLGPYVSGGAIQRTSTYLVMSHDSNEATLTLKDDKPHLQGLGEGRSKNILRIKDCLEMVIKHTGASMGFSYFYGRNQDEVSVHVLGGANMSRDGTGREGVTNHRGQVYTGHGSGIYPGLVCCDASVVPTSLGVNPLATITALAERSVALVAEESGLEVDLETPNADIDADSTPRVSHFKIDLGDEEFVSTGWQFTEALEGYVSVPGGSSFEVSEREGKGSSSAIRMLLTVGIRRKVQSGPRYQGVCTGTVSCRALSRRTMRVMKGQVDFFVPGDTVDSTTLRYRLPLHTVEGEELMLVGTKTIGPSCAFSASRLWKATTVVNVQIASRGESLGAGVLHIPLSSFQRQIRSFRSTGPTFAALPALLMFLLYFILQISLFFLHPLIPRWFTSAKRYNRFEARQPTSTHEISASDGVTVKLELYSPSKSLNKPPILFLPGVTGLNPEHSIYTLPFQRTNMVDYFTSHGYSCYVLVPRWSFNARTAKDCTVFDSRLDIAAALQHISQESRDQKPYIIAHCQGSVALAMGLLDGSIPSSQILGITANSVFITQIFPFWNSVKASSPLLIRLYEFLDGPYFPISFLLPPTPNHKNKDVKEKKMEKKKDILQHALDAILSFYPVPHARDLCTSSTCHRTSFAFGLLWDHKNLSPATHDNIDRFFTGTYTKLLSHVVRTGSRGGCLEYKQAVPDAQLERLRGLPILFMSGAENQVFSPESTLRDYELLRREFGEGEGEGLYRRFLVEGYGHLDTIVGDRAVEDVFWRVKGHLDGLVASNK